MGIIDWIAFVTGVICVWLIVRERDINWPIGLVNSLALLIVFATQKLYAQAGLQAFYVVECAYGWWMWTRVDRATGRKVIRIGRTKRQTLIALLLIAAGGVGLLYPIFKRTGDPAPFWDGVISAMSLVAEYMLCLKFFEAWAVYFGADLISLILLGYLGMWVIFGTYLCFTILCVLGWLEWRKRMMTMASNSGAASSLASSTP